MDDLDDPLQTSTLRLNVQRYGAALVEKSRLLLVCCPSPALLEQQGNGLVSWLRRNHPELQLEAVPALEGELIIQRFNEILADVSIDAAVRPDAPTPPNRVWVLRDTGQLNDHDVRLLAKLQQQFPKARLSSIVITGQPDRFAALMASQDRGLLCWSQAVPAEPKPAQAPAPAPAPQAERPAPTPPAPAPAPAPAPRAKPGPTMPRTAPAPRSAQRLQKLMMGVVLGFATSTTLVVAALLWLHSTGQLGDLKAWMGKNPPASSAVVSSLAAASAEASPPASATQTAPEPGASASSAVAPLAEGTAQTSSSNAGIPGGQASPAAQPQPAASSAAQAISSGSLQPAPTSQVREMDGRATAQADPRVPAPVPPALRDGLAWAGKLPAGNFLVVHGRFASVAQAVQASRGQPYLQNARLLPAGPGATGQVMLVTGPFQSEPRARGYISRLELKDASVLQVGDWLAR